jgi:hypothetical protein
MRFSEALRRFNRKWAVVRRGPQRREKGVVAVEGKFEDDPYAPVNRARDA